MTLLSPAVMLLYACRNEFEQLTLHLDWSSSNGVMKQPATAGAAGAGLAAAVNLFVTKLLAEGSPAGEAAGHLLAVDGMTAVPATINVQLTSAAGFVGIVAAFFVGTTFLVIILTACCTWKLHQHRLILHQGAQ
jgi:hypothetical protein